MKKLIIGLLTFLCIFTIGAIFITYLSIEYVNGKNNSDTKNMVIKENITNENGIDLYGTYDQNDLIITELVEDYNGVEIKIPKIEGLKNINVQDKVNKSLYTEFYKLISKYPNVNYASFYTRANFANVISISFHVANDNSNEQLYLTYNLVDGEELKLEDLFIRGTDIKEIVRNAFYNSLSRDNVYRMDSQIYSDEEIVFPDEMTLYKVVKGYMDSKNKVFSLSPDEICFYYEDYMASVKMVDIYDKVSIYSKYLTNESLYSRNDIGYKNIINCANGFYDIFEKIEYGYLEDNFWYDITFWDGYRDVEMEQERENKFNKLKKSVYDEIWEEVNRYREIAKNNPNKFYILFSKPDFSIYYKSESIDNNWIDTYSNMATVSKNIEILEMPRDFFESAYKDKLLEAYRYEYFAMAGGAYLHDAENEDKITIKINRENICYNYITGGELKTIQDIFYEDSNYLEIIKEKTKENLMEKYNYSEDEVNNWIETINYELDGACINVTIPTLEDFFVRVYFDKFDESMMKIFDA